MTLKFNWADLPPYNHGGNWAKNKRSIMNPLVDVTFPQFVAEMVFFNRSVIIKTFPKIIKGQGWSRGFEAQYRSVIQQCYNLCNYFPRPDDDPLVEIAFKNFFKNTRCISIGCYRKTRVTKTKKINISQAEKDVVKGISIELERLKSQQKKIIDKNDLETIKEDYTKSDNIVSIRPSYKPKKNTFADILELERSLEKQNEQERNR
jgi:hypothetical protein